MHLKKVKLNPDQYPTRDHYPFNLDLFQQTRSIPLDTPVTFFVGENGSGSPANAASTSGRASSAPATTPALMKTLYTRTSTSNGPTAAG